MENPSMYGSSPPVIQYQWQMKQKFSFHQQDHQKKIWSWHQHFQPLLPCCVPAMHEEVAEKNTGAYLVFICMFLLGGSSITACPQGLRGYFILMVVSFWSLISNNISSFVKKEKLGCTLGALLIYSSGSHSKKKRRKGFLRCLLS